MSEKIEEYPYIKAWSKWLQSGDVWAETQVARARADSAPNDAIYYAPEDARWIRASEITNGNIRNAIYAEVAKQRLADMQA